MIFGRYFVLQTESSEPTEPNRNFSTSGWTSFPLNRFLVDTRPYVRRPVWRLRIGPAHLVWAYVFSGSEPSTRWVGPICSMKCRVNGTGAECMGWPIYSKAHQADGIGLANSTNKFREVRVIEKASRPISLCPSRKWRFLDFLILIEQIGLAHVIFSSNRARPIAVRVNGSEHISWYFFPREVPS